MAKKKTPTRAASTPAAVQFTTDDIEALKVLVGYVLALDVVRPPYTGDVQTVLMKLGLLHKDSPEMHATAASLRAPVRMQ